MDPKSGLCLLVISITAFLSSCSPSFTILSYNVGAFGKYEEDSSPEVARIIKAARADVVTLNELDSCNRRHGFDQSKQLSGHLGWKWSFGRAMSYAGGAYGNGVILPSRTRVLARYTLPLPKEGGSEPRSAAFVETDKYVIGAVHLDFADEDAAIAQAKVINEWVSRHYSGSLVPVFLCGDMNFQPGSRPILELQRCWTRLSADDLSFPSKGPKVCIDHIFCLTSAAPVRVISAGAVSPSSPIGKKAARHGASIEAASDHLPIFARLSF